MVSSHCGGGKGAAPPGVCDDTIRRGFVFRGIPAFVKNVSSVIPLNSAIGGGGICDGGAGVSVRLRSSDKLLFPNLHVRRAHDPGDAKLGTGSTCFTFPQTGRIHRSCARACCDGLARIVF